MLEAIHDLGKITESSDPEKVQILKEISMNTLNAYEVVALQLSQLIDQDKDVTSGQAGKLFKHFDEYRKLCLEVQDSDHFAGIPGYHPKGSTEESRNQSLLQLPSFYLYRAGFEISDQKEEEALQLLDIVWLGIPVGGISTDKLAQIMDPKAFEENPDKAIIKVKKLTKNAMDLLSGTTYPGKIAPKLMQKIEQ